MTQFARENPGYFFTLAVLTLFVVDNCVSNIVNAIRARKKDKDV